MAGVLGALAPWIFLSLLALWVGLVAFVRDIGLASVVASIAAIGVGIWVFATMQDPARPWLAALLLILPLVVIVRHRSNLRRWLAAREKNA